MRLIFFDADVGIPGRNQGIARRVLANCAGRPRDGISTQNAGIAMLRLRLFRNLLNGLSLYGRRRSRDFVLVIERGNEVVVPRLFALDTQTYQAGALDVKTKELLGLVASLVLRCDDCISYHVAQCQEAGVIRDEMFEAFSVGLVVGGSIVIRTCAAPWIFSTSWNRAPQRPRLGTTTAESRRGRLIVFARR